MAAQGTDAKGRGGANAASVFRLEPAGDGSKVLVHTNLTLSGAVAQYGRGVGIIQATAAQFMNQFAKCLKDKLGQQRVAAPPPVDAATPMPPARADRSAPSPATPPSRSRAFADGAGDLELDHRPVPALVAAQNRFQGLSPLLRGNSAICSWARFRGRRFVPRE